jgi:hypothetical protein
MIIMSLASSKQDRIGGTTDCNVKTIELIATCTAGKTLCTEELPRLFVETLPEPI